MYPIDTPTSWDLLSRICVAVCDVLRGYYSNTPDARPLIGPYGAKNAYVCGGMGTYGLMGSPAAGELLAMHVVGRSLPSYAMLGSSCVVCVVGVDCRLHDSTTGCSVARDACTWPRKTSALDEVVDL